MSLTALRTVSIPKLSESHFSSPYQSPDPLPEARRPLLNFILGSGAGEAAGAVTGLLASNLIHRSIVHNAMRVVIRMLREPAQAQVLEDIFHVAASG